ncbi:hypothetical protein RFZ01_08405, partial [Acinetobacter pittii]
HLQSGAFSSGRTAKQMGDESSGEYQGRHIKRNVLITFMHRGKQQIGSSVFFYPAQSVTKDNK